MKIEWAKIVASSMFVTGCLIILYKKGKKKSTIKEPSEEDREQAKKIFDELMNRPETMEEYIKRTGIV